MAKGFGMYVVFHMAFDEISLENQKRAVDDLVELGVRRILTKGGPFANAMEGKSHLKKLIKMTKGRIEILPGKGLN